MSLAVGGELRGTVAEDQAQVAGRLLAGVEAFIQGKPEVVELAVISLVAEGHLLLDDVPGVGKTSLARALANSLGVDWRRIQFTPDLLPSDVTGVSVFRHDLSGFEFHPGPIFSSVVLADEVNRAGPRTQSALLEAMEERTVSVDGATHKLPSPFMVIATQNPVDMAGTYPLPEAQLDRFLIRTSIGYPDRASEAAIVTAHQHGSSVQDLKPVVTAEHVQGLIALARGVRVDPSVVDYLVAVTAWTRDADGVALGASPRASIAMLRAAQARALIRGRDSVTPEDIQSLAEPVLAHRIVLDVEGEARGLTPASVIAAAIEAVPAPQPA